MTFTNNFGKGITCTIITKDVCDDEGYIESFEWHPKKPPMRGKLLKDYKVWFNWVNKQIADHYECVIVHVYHTDDGFEAYIFAPGQEPKPATLDELKQIIQ